MALLASITIRFTPAVYNAIIAYKELKGFGSYQLAIIHLVKLALRAEKYEGDL